MFISYILYNYIYAICNTFTPQIKSSSYAKHKIIRTSDFINSF